MLSHNKTNGFSIVRAFSRSFLMLCAMLALFLGTTQVNAAVLYFDSFEDPTYSDRPDGAGFPINSVNGWTTSGSFAEFTDPAEGYYFDGTTGNSQGELPHGFQGLLIQQGTTIAKSLGSTVPGTTYTLTGRIGDLRGTSGNPLGTDEPAAQISLLLFVNSVQVASATAFPTANTTPPFASPTVDYVFNTLTTTPYVAASVLPNIEIRIAATASLGNFSFVDAIQLDAVEAAVPEPSTLVLAALGLAGLGLVAWRRRRK